MEKLEIRKSKLEGEIEGIKSILKFIQLQPLSSLMNDDFLSVENFVNSKLCAAKLELESMKKLTAHKKMTYKVENPITGSSIESQEIEIVHNGLFVDGRFFDAKVYNFFKIMPGEVNFVEIEFEV
mgnify:CR=1 FL=1